MKEDGTPALNGIGDMSIHVPPIAMSFDTTVLFSAGDDLVHCTNDQERVVYGALANKNKMGIYDKDGCRDRDLDKS